MVKQTYTCEKILKRSVHVSRRQKEESAFKDWKSVCELGVLYQHEFPGFDHTVWLWKIQSVGEAELKYSRTHSTILQLLEATYFKMKSCN